MIRESDRDGTDVRDAFRDQTDKVTPWQPPVVMSEL